MESGWIINFKNDSSVILTEEAYKKYAKNRDITKVSDEEHWFSIEDAKRKNPNLPVIL